MATEDVRKLSIGTHVHKLLGAVLISLLAAGWARAQDSALTEYAPASPDAAIKAVSLGPGRDNKFDHGQTGTIFPEGTTQVAVWYRWEQANRGLRIDNRWWLGGRTILEQGEAVSETAGRAAWFLRTGEGSPLPAGSYEVELLENGVVVTSIPFTVGQ